MPYPSIKQDGRLDEWEREHGPQVLKGGDALKGYSITERERELERCKRSSWYLGTRYLGYGWNPKAREGQFPGNGLTARLHRRIMRWYDYCRDEPFLGFWCQRFGLKTTMNVVFIIQEILRDPNIAIRYFHNVDGEAEKVVKEVAMHFLNNDRLRSLDPIGVDPNGKPVKCFPSKNQTRFVKSGGTQGAHFFLRRPNPRINVRWPSLLGHGINTEATGSHADLAFLDDIIALRTILNSELGKVQSIWENTIIPIIDGCRFRVTGTPWSHEGLYAMWQDDPTWKTRIVPGAIADEDMLELLDDLEAQKIHLEPDYDFKVPTFGPKEYEEVARKRLKMLQKQMKSHFAPQIMVDALPPSELAWDQTKCERWTGKEQTMDAPGILGEGTIFVLSDPAPWLVGSYAGITEKQRGDGSKDFWSIAVVKLRNRGQFQDIILLDGAHSQEWSHQAGADMAARLMKRWRTPYWISENPDEHFPYMRLACRRMGIHLATDHRTRGPLKFRDYNKKDRKNASFLALCDKARQEEFWIYEGCPKEFVEGDGDRIGVLPQCRKWKKMKHGYTSLRWDDDADITARATDPILQEIQPPPAMLDYSQEDPYKPLEFSPYVDMLNAQQEQFDTSRCKYIPGV